MNIKAAAGLLPAWQLINAARASIYFPFRRQLFAFRAAAERERERALPDRHISSSCEFIYARTAAGAVSA
jgi:hypothetical protein